MALSPMMEHYLKVKEQYRDCVLFYRLGDFYEMFFEDAVRVSKLLDLTLTDGTAVQRNVRPCAGFPFMRRILIFQSLCPWGRRLRSANSLPIPKRARAWWNGTLFGSFRQARSSKRGCWTKRKTTTLPCACKIGSEFALAWADITTGEFSVCNEENAESAVAHLVNLSVAEIICNDEMLFAVKDCAEVERKILPAFSCYLPWAFSASSAEKNLKTQFAAATLEGLGMDGKTTAVCAGGRIGGISAGNAKTRFEKYQPIAFFRTSGIHDARSDRRAQFGAFEKQRRREEIRVAFMAARSDRRREWAQESSHRFSFRLFWIGKRSTRDWTPWTSCRKRRS